MTWWWQWCGEGIEGEGSELTGSETTTHNKRIGHIKERGLIRLKRIYNF
jgi:hypothetical protein